MFSWRFLGAAVILCCYGAQAEGETTDDTILGGARVGLSASSEIEAFVCAFNEKGGMISEIVEASFNASDTSSETDWKFVDNPLKLDLIDAASSERVVFPMYKPRCDNNALLNAHTAMLCQDFAWSDPLFHIIMTGYVAADGDWSPRNNSDLMGRTVCQPKGEVSFYLRERGISDLNARIVTTASPAACLKLVVAGESDIAILPMVSANQAIKKGALSEAVRHTAELDLAMSVHAIAGRDQNAALEQLEVLDRGLSEIRATGAWFEIVKEHSNGHSHDHKHHAHNDE